jgi:hypothetical protein
MLKLGRHALGLRPSLETTLRASLRRVLRRFGAIEAQGRGGKFLTPTALRNVGPHPKLIRSNASFNFDDRNPVAILGDDSLRVPPIRRSRIAVVTKRTTAPSLCPFTSEISCLICRFISAREGRHRAVSGHSFDHPPPTCRFTFLNASLAFSLWIEDPSEGRRSNRGLLMCLPHSK